MDVLAGYQFIAATGSLRIWLLFAAHRAWFSAFVYVFADGFFQQPVPGLAADIPLHHTVLPCAVLLVRRATLLPALTACVIFATT